MVKDAGSSELSSIISQVVVISSTIGGMICTMDIVMIKNGAHVVGG